MVKQIQCAEGKIALVDNEDYPLLSRFTWSVVGGYPCFWHHIRFRGDGSTHIQMHKLVTGGFNTVDHIDRNKFNNQKKNLRPATAQQNGWNKGKNRANNKGKPCSSKYKGVMKIKGEWRVRIRITKRDVKPIQMVDGGPFKTELDAAKWYNKEIVKHRGKWAWINPLPKDEKTS